MLKQRLITAAILIPLMLGILFFFSPPYFCLFVTVITLAAGWEWTNLMGIKRKSVCFMYLLILLTILFNSLFVPVPLILFLAIVWWLFALGFVISYPRGSNWFAKNKLVRGLLGIFVLVPCWAAINYIRNLNEGIFALLFLFVLIWGADSVAYFAGKRFGTLKLAKMVSPGKSVQGVVAALLFALLFTLLVLNFSNVPSRLWVYLATLSALTVLFSVLGDLFESMLKRQMDLKDSGNLLPGHGGLLDRIDSLTAAAPVFAFGTFLLLTVMR